MRAGARPSQNGWPTYTGMRSAVFDHWLTEQTADRSEVVVIHIGCGMDSRAERVGVNDACWYDVDFPLMDCYTTFAAETSKFKCERA